MQRRFLTVALQWTIDVKVFQYQYWNYLKTIHAFIYYFYHVVYLEVNKEKLPSNFAGLKSSTDSLTTLIKIE